MKSHINHKHLNWIEGKVAGFNGKDILNVPNGSIKIVSVSPNSEYPKHIHPDKTEFIYVIEGKVICTIDECQIEVTKGEFAIFPQNAKHSIMNKEVQEALLIVGGIKV